MPNLRHTSAGDDMERTSYSGNPAEPVVRSVGNARLRGPESAGAAEWDGLARAFLHERAGSMDGALTRFCLDVIVSWLVNPGARGFASIGALLEARVPFDRLHLVMGDANDRRVHSLPELEGPQSALPNDDGTIFPLEKRDLVKIGYLQLSRRRPLEESEAEILRLTAACIVAASLERERMVTRGNRSGGRVRGVDALGRREREVADLVGLGLTNTEIAGRMGISPFTVANHLRHVYRKLQVSNRAEMVRLLLSS